MPFPEFDPVLIQIGPRRAGPAARPAWASGQWHGQANLLDEAALSDIERVRQLLDELESAEAIARVLDAAREAGADHVIRYKEDDVAAHVREITDGQGVPVTFDGIGMATWATSLKATAPSAGNAMPSSPAITA